MYKYLIILIFASFSAYASDVKPANDSLKNERLTNSYICYGNIVAQIVRNFSNDPDTFDGLINETCIRYGVPANSTLCNDFIKKTIDSLAMYIGEQTRKCDAKDKSDNACIQSNEVVDQEIYSKKCSKKEKEDWLTMHAEIRNQLRVQQLINANRARMEAQIENSAEQRHLQD